MSSTLSLSIAGESVRLWAGRALDWPAGRTLFIADPHFGKSGAFRAYGVAAPDGTADDLKRLDALLAGSGAERLVVLGDFAHARAGYTPGLIDALTQWRARNHALEILLVRGNHDLNAGDPPAGLHVRCVPEPWNLGAFVACHVPQESCEGHVLAGHVHPGMVLRERNGASVRAACFVTGSQLTYLPAFGSFTGTKAHHRRRDERCFVVAGESLIEIP